MQLRKEPHMSGLAKTSLATRYLALAAVALAGCAAADEGPQPMIVSTDWVAERLEEPDLVLLHVGEREVYDGAHLPGAQYVDRSLLSTPHGEGLMLEMPSTAELQKAFEAMGVSDDSRIVVYFGEDWVTPTARVYLTLDYVGLGERASIMDGGMRVWVAEGRVVTRAVPPVEPGSFTPNVREDVLADLEWVTANADDPAVALIDARNTEFYTGERSGRDMRAGHIPGARSLPYADVVNEETLKFRSDDELSQMFLAAGADLGDRVISYCHIGQQASLVYFVAKHLGYDARMYDGSFEEYSAQEELPVEGSARNPTELD
jgi:thiosulfate/3-mercaptopyruvate sulfurtransferase